MTMKMIASSTLLAVSCCGAILVAAEGDRIQDVDAPEKQVSLLPDPTALTHPHVADELIVRFLPEVTMEARQAVFDSVGGSVKYAYTLVADLYCLTIDRPVADAIGTLEFRNDVLAYVEPVYLMETFDTIPNDQYWNQLCGMDRINAPAAWDEGTGSSTVRIAIIDSGTDMDHPDLVDNIIVNNADPVDGVDNDGNGLIDDRNGWDFYSGDNNPNDQNGHGTHTSGTVGAVGNNGIGVAGVNWTCELIPLRVGDYSLSTSAIYASVQYACTMGARVSNNSYGGGGYAQAFFDIIQNAGNQYDHVFCAAAGNGGYSGASYPAAYTCNNIISVAATDCNDNLASFSQYGIPSVDIAAPGVDTYSTVPGGYDSFSGTSMATPHVAGLVGLIQSQLTNATAVEVIDIVLDNARPVSSLNGDVVTGGIIDAEASMQGLFAGPVATMTSSVPSIVEPGTEVAVNVNIDPRDDVLTAASVLFRTDNGSFSWVSVPLTNTSGNSWRATLPAVACEDSPQFYVSFTGAKAGNATLPTEGSTNPYSYSVGEFELIASDDFNSNGGWTVSSGAATGNWERAIPSNDTISVEDCIAPGADGDGSGYCFVTGNGLSTFGCEFDIDDGTTVLTSPVYQVDNSDAVCSFQWWYDNTNANNTAYDDTFVIEVSGNSGSSWSNLYSLNLGNSKNTGWATLEFVISDYVSVSSGFQVRFTAGDTGEPSVVEAGVDGFSISSVSCEDDNGGGGGNGPDINGDGVVDGEDLSIILGFWGPCNDPSDCPADVDGDGVVNGSDLSIVLGFWSN